MKHRFFEWLLISLFLCISPTIYAQQIKVSGLVTDKDKEPLIGVAVFTESKNAAGKKTVGKVKNIHKIGDEIYEDQSKR